MAKKVKKSGLAAALGSAGRKAVEKVRGNETTFSAGGDLPGGIEGGIAQLVDCKFDTYSRGSMEGEYYFLAAGIVKKPKTFEGHRVEGLRTQIMEPVCDTSETRPNSSRKTIDEHIDWVLNEMRKLGVDTSELELEDMEAAAEALREAKPHFRFRTWQGSATPQFPEPRVNHQWRGVCDPPEDEDEDELADEVVEDDTEEEEEGEEVTEETDETDLDALVKDANQEDVAACDALTARAQEYGIDASEIETWEEVADLIREAEEGDDGEEEEEEAEDEEEEEGAVEPEKGEVYFYKPPRSRKKIEVEVTAVFAGKQRVNAKSLDDGKLFKNVPFDKLEME